MDRILFGLRIKKARETAGLSKAELAKRLGMSAAMITYYEKNEKFPGFQNLAKMSEILNVTSDWLLGIEKDEDPSDEEVLMGYSDWFLSTIKTPEERERAIRIMRKLRAPLKPGPNKEE